MMETCGYVILKHFKMHNVAYGYLKQIYFRFHLFLVCFSIYVITRDLVLYNLNFIVQSPKRALLNVLSLCGPHHLLFFS